MTAPLNHVIGKTLFATLANAALGYPISWPGVNFATPESGIWLEVNFLPNAPLDNGLAAADDIIPQGLMTIMVLAKPGTGVFSIQEAAESVAALYPKNASVVDLVRITRNPYQLDISESGERVGIVLRIPYSG